MNAEDLAAQWLAERARLATQQAILDAISEQLTALLGAKPEGSQTHKTGMFAITINGRMNYRCDDMAALIDRAPELVKPELHEGAVKKLRQENPTEYARIADLLTVKPGKTGVMVKLLEAA